MADPVKSDEHYWGILKTSFDWTDERIAQAKSEGKQPYGILSESIGGDFDRFAGNKAPTQEDIDTRAGQDAQRDERGRAWLRDRGGMSDAEIDAAMQEGGVSAHQLYTSTMATKSEETSRKYLKDELGWSDVKIDNSMEQGDQTAQELANRELGSLENLDTAFPDEDMFAERPTQFGGDISYQTDSGLVRPPRTMPPPGLPPGYKRNLELIDWLKEVTPGAKDLQYDAPTYKEEWLQLPTSSQAGGAVADPIAKAAQYKALAGMKKELGNRGMGPEDILALTRVSKQAEASRLSGEQSRLRDLQGRGMTASGAQLAGGLAQGNRLRGAVQEARGDVLSQYAKRGQQAAQQLGQYGSRLGQQTFGERFERASAKDAFARSNAKALNRRGEDIRGMSNRAEKQDAISHLQASGMRRAPAAGYLNFYQTEAGARGREEANAAAIEAENARRGASGPGAVDWITGLGTLAAGIYTLNPALIAAGGAKTIGNVEGETNKPKKIKKGETYSYGDD